MFRGMQAHSISVGMMKRADSGRPFGLPFLSPGSICRSVKRHGLCVDPSHGLGEHGIGFVADVDHAVIAVLSVEAALHGLVDMLKPMVADEERVAEGALHVVFKVLRPVRLRGNLGSPAL